MIDLSSFTVGLGAIALQLNQAATVEKIRAYHEILGPETTPDEWLAFVRGTPTIQPAVKRFGWRFLPAVPELLDALEVHRGRESLGVEAVRAYERVLATRTYTVDGEAVWVYRQVIEVCGVAAGIAFLAAGGGEAFRTTYGEDRRRERFIAAYTAEARSAPAGRLGAAAPLALGDGAPIPVEDAKRIIQQIEARAAALPKEEA